ncbi:nuclear transport factor 2 family protein [Streptosporangiaceae bacterium NEAU-GS5]|nr:nuclear transport factor 2 family protein [Streptosporangiaceae bacterium NEAU-GS5]
MARVDRFFEAVNAQDLDAVAGCCAADVFLRTPSGQADDRDEALYFHQVIWDAFPDQRFTIDKAITQDTDVVVAVTITGTHEGPLLLAGGSVMAPTGRRMSLSACWTFCVEDDLIMSHQLYWDQLELYAELGIALPDVS